MSLLDLGKYKIEFDTIIQEYIGKAIQEYEVRDALRLMLGNHSIKKRIVHIYTVFHFERTNGLCTFSYRWKIHRGVYSQYL